ncbi:Asp-tRNA(Asn)/Glu-tRNA(Gln) amidotransferase subunit GatC [Thioalkalicoccus limnaeus]|uniref:Aspartyl/glutamyl-tRNA(Asn/Gln) amidotransferase subunit C n=1 Tax=Thioalkalicoccus limnaeus TaxID=120681 RepID=A0ABV4BCN6_9GAMM
MSLTPSDIAKIADLARLAISDDDARGYATELTSILDLVARMDRVDTSGIAPLAHPLDMVQRLRADEPCEPNQRSRFQKVAPLTEDGLYLVPKVIE